MTRDEALEILTRGRCDNDSCSSCEYLHDPWPGDTGQPTEEELAEAKQVLSSLCARGERDEIGATDARIHIGQVDPGKFRAWAHIFNQDVLVPIGEVVDGQWVDVLVFPRDALPAEEGT